MAPGNDTESAPLLPEEKVPPCCPKSFQKHRGYPFWKGYIFSKVYLHCVSFQKLLHSYEKWLAVTFCGWWCANKNHFSITFIRYLLAYEPNRLFRGLLCKYPLLEFTVTCGFYISEDFEGFWPSSVSWLNRG